jgi:hypothetical protein
MKPASQIMATLPNQAPERHRGPVAISLDTAEVVNDLFRRLRGIFPAWRQAWPSTQALAAAKEEWIKAFADEGICTCAQIELGLKKCRKLSKPFAPSVGEFIALCSPGPEDVGMPPPAGAWLEALKGTYSHEGVKIAAVVTSLFDLRNARQDDKGLRQRFDHHYAIVLRRAQAGEPLDGAHLTSVVHDHPKTELAMAIEAAEHQFQARLVRQGIPADGQSARALLLATLNIRREPPGTGEGR